MQSGRRLHVKMITYYFLLAPVHNYNKTSVLASFACNQPTSDGLQPVARVPPRCGGLQPRRDSLQPTFVLPGFLKHLYLQVGGRVASGFQLRANYPKCVLFHTCALHASVATKPTSQLFMASRSLKATTNSSPPRYCFGLI